MRGKIIQYNGSDGTGTIFADGQQYRFAIAAWKSDSVPAAGKVVEVVVDDGVITAVVVVADDVLLREKATELGGKLGSLAGSLASRLSAPASAGGGGKAESAAHERSASASVGGGLSAGSLIERYGKLMLASYVVFLLATQAFHAVTMSGFGQHLGWSFFDIAGYMSQLGAGGGGSIKTVLLLAYVGALAPLFWRDRRAWLVLAAPLLALVWAGVTVLHTLDSVGGRFADEMSSLFSVGPGLPLAFAAAIVLAAGGAKRFLRGA
jgi:hypothetical protein